MSNVKLDDDTVLEIKRLYKLGNPSSVLALRFGVSRSAINKVLNGSTHRGVGDKVSPGRVGRPRGQAPHLRKLSALQIQALRLDYDKGMTLKQLAKKYGVCATTAAKYAHVDRL